jgi:hypothetical protein
MHWHIVDFGIDLYVECFEHYGIVLARIGMHIGFHWFYTWLSGLIIIYGV